MFPVDRLPTGFDFSTDVENCQVKALKENKAIEAAKVGGAHVQAENGEIQYAEWET